MNSEKATKFWLALHRTKERGRFRKIFWPSQNIWTVATDAQWSLVLLKSRIFGLGQINSWAFGVFSAELSAPILVWLSPNFFNVCCNMNLIISVFFRAHDSLEINSLSRPLHVILLTIPHWIKFLLFQDEPIALNYARIASYFALMSLPLQWVRIIIIIILTNSI